VSAWLLLLLYWGYSDEGDGSAVTIVDECRGIGDDVGMGTDGLIVAWVVGLNSEHGLAFQSRYFLVDGIEQLLRRVPLFGVLLEAASEYLADLFVATAADLARHEVTAHFEVTQVLIGGFAQQGFEEDDADAPDIAFGAVTVLPIALGAHVGG
jgi:hypothetical protein